MQYRKDGNCFWDKKVNIEVFQATLNDPGDISYEDDDSDYNDWFFDNKEPISDPSIDEDHEYDFLDDSNTQPELTLEDLQEVFGVK